MILALKLRAICAVIVGDCISIANSDSEAHAYVDGAVDAADRAVNEQIQLAKR